MLKTSYLPTAKESTVYFALVWGLVLIGCLILLAGFDQPLVLIVISATVGGLMMFIYSGPLILVNRRLLPAEIRINTGRVAVLCWSIALFGVLAALTVVTQVGELFGG